MTSQTLTHGQQLGISAASFLSNHRLSTHQGINLQQTLPKSYYLGTYNSRSLISVPFSIDLGLIELRLKDIFGFHLSLHT